jgi:putative nucleotidyltransferase with HDIG domain
MGIRNMIMGERLLLELFPETLSAWAWAFKLEHFSAHFVVPLFLLFFRELYPTRIRRVPFFLIIAVGMAWAGMILFLPPALYQRFLHVYEVFLLAAGAYVLFVLATALKGGDRDASIAVAGLAILVATAANDVLLSTGVIRGSFYMASIGVFLYIFAQSFHLSLIFSRAFREVEDLNRSLKNKNRELESLHTIDLAIASSMELDRVLEIILEQAVSRLGMDAADVLLLDSAAPASAGVAERDTLRCAARLGFRTDALIHTRLRIGEGYAGKAIQTGNAVLVEALDTDSAGFSRSPAFAGENFCFYASRPLSVRGKVEGVLELYRRSPFAQVPSWEQYFETLAAQAAVALDNSFLLQSLKLANAELLASYESTIESWAGALELRDQETEGHSRRVTAATTELAQRFGFAGAELDNLRRGALLHDIGKMGIPDTILLKPGPLTDEEFIVMKRHPAIARNLLIRLRFLEPSMDIPYSHHEKWDGRGYPQGLRGTDIPLSARLFAVVDVWDALRSDRPYRAAWDEEKTLAHIASLAGTHFDPEVAEAFIGMRRGYRA